MITMHIVCTKKRKKKENVLKNDIKPIDKIGIKEYIKTHYKGRYWGCKIRKKGSRNHGKIKI